MEEGCSSQRGRRMFFSKDDDIEMMGLVVSENPFMNKMKWMEIAQVLRERRLKKFTLKNVRERVNLLISVFREKDKKQVSASGKEESYEEIDQLLQEASDLKREADADPQLRKKKKILLQKGKDAREKAAFTYVNDQMFTVEIVENDGAWEEPILNPLAHTTEEAELPVIGEQLLAGSVASASGAPSSSIPPTMPTTAAGSVASTSGAPSSSIPTTMPTTAAGSVASTSGAPSSSIPPTMPTTARNSPARSRNSDVIHTPHRPPVGPSKKASKNTMVQQIWSKLKDEQAYKTELVAVERVKAENEKKRLEVEELKIRLKYDVECKRIKLISDHFEQTTRFQETMLTVVESLIKKGSTSTPPSDSLL